MVVQIPSFMLFNLLTLSHDYTNRIAAHKIIHRFLRYYPFNCNLNNVNVRNTQLVPGDVFILQYSQVYPHYVTTVTGNKPFPFFLSKHAIFFYFLGIAEVFAETLAESGIDMTRLPIQHGLKTCQWLTEQKRKFFLQIQQQSKVAQSSFKEFGIR